MQVRELKNLLEHLPDSYDILLHSGSGAITPLMSCEVTPVYHSVTFRNYRVTREPKIIKSWDGQEFEIPYL
jgi:hypothetical protein